MNMDQALGILKPSGNSAGDLKTAYRLACKKYHPDINPNSLELMKLINVAYDFLKEHLNKWSFDNIKDDIGIDEILQEIFDKIKRFAGINSEVCGTWLWVSGDTKPYKEQFKEAGLKWARKKGMWYWRPAGYRKRGKKVFSIDEIRSKYGSVGLNQEESQQVD
tara:strand:+ start:129 stop:617 length:489 start_codon:yes stop_codon:yes gene_type:complete